MKINERDISLERIVRLDFLIQKNLVPGSEQRFCQNNIDVFGYEIWYKPRLFICFLDNLTLDPGIPGLPQVKNL